jgi:PKD repeat protein
VVSETSSKGRLAAVLGLIIFPLALLSACSMRQDSLTAIVYPNLELARAEGFHLLTGHPPFTVHFRAEVEGGDGALSYDWDLDGDGASDSDAPDPEFVYTDPGEYTASVSITDERRQNTRAEQRIVVVGEPQWPHWRFGVATHFDRYESDAEVQTEARMIAEAGIEAARLDLDWDAVQPDGGDQYKWEKYDSIVGLSRQYGFDLLPIIAYSAQWASIARDARSRESRTKAPPAPDEYAWFAYEAVDRYKADIRAWEVWNEPNSSRFWRPKPDPALYAELLKKAYLAIKYADPKAVVVLGGLAPADETGRRPREALHPPAEFVQAVYDQGGGAYFDVLGSHPYTNPTAGSEGLIRKLDILRTTMADNGDDRKPIWLTEYGLPSVPEEATTDEARARWLTESLDALSSTNYTTTVFWYDFSDDGNDPYFIEHNYGLVKEDFEIKPAYWAYKDYIEKNR